MDKRSRPRSEDRITIATDYLRRAQIDLDQAKRTRIRYMHLGYSHGMTHREIGAALGISDVAAGNLMRRNPIDAHAED